MKKLLLTAAIVAFFGFAATAQEQGDIRVGAGLAIGTKAGAEASATGVDSKLGLGINIGAEYLITDAISLAPSYTFFFKNSIGGADYSLSALNIDARYYFADSGFYGLAGFSSVSSKAEGGGFSVTSSESGLNIGAGIMYPLSDNLFANGQVKYQTPGDGQLVINAGVAFAF